MKSKFVMGMVLAVSLTSSISMAAGATKGTIKDALTDYNKTVRENIYGNGKSAAGLSPQAMKEVQANMISKLGISADRVSNLKLALSDSSKAAQRMDNLVSALAAKNLATSWKSSDPVLAKSIEDAADASTSLIVNSSLIGAIPVSKELSAGEMTMVSSALGKLESLPEVILTKFETQERDSYTAIIKRHNELVESGKKATTEEAFIQAIMDIKKVDKKKALELAQKLKECLA